MDVTQIQGIDISRHQGQLPIERVRSEGYRFIIAKASEGEGYIDPLFDRHARATIDAGLDWGAYHFARPDTNGGDAQDGYREAKDFCAAIKSIPGWQDRSLPPTLDWEKYHGRPLSQAIEWIESFVEVVETEIGRSPMVYTGRNIWKHTTGGTGAACARSA